MKILIGGLILLVIGCDSQSLPVITPQPKPRVDTIRVVDTVFQNDTIFLPERYVLIRSCITDVVDAPWDTLKYDVQYPGGDFGVTPDSNGVLMTVKYPETRVWIRTEVRDTITFKDGKFFWPRHLCSCWGCLDSLRIERIQ
jgi:hypothetical protein